MPGSPMSESVNFFGKKSNPLFLRQNTEKKGMTVKVALPLLFQ
jgi:hypothetical protein